LEGNIPQAVNSGVCGIINLKKSASWALQNVLLYAISIIIYFQIHSQLTAGRRRGQQGIAEVIILISSQTKYMACSVQNLTKEAFEIM